jgi:hypothetical protein
MCSDSTTSSSPFLNHLNNPDIPVCPGVSEIRGKTICTGTSYSLTTYVNRLRDLRNSGFWENWTVDTYYLDFWTEACDYQIAWKELHHQRHWAVRLDSAGANMPYLEVHCEWRFPSVGPRNYWYVNAVLEPYHQWEPYIAEP